MNIEFLSRFLFEFFLFAGICIGYEFIAIGSEQFENRTAIKLKALIRFLAVIMGMYYLFSNQEPIFIYELLIIVLPFIDFIVKYYVEENNGLKV